MQRVYLASPLGFTDVATRSFRADLVRALEEAGVCVVDPWADDETVKRLLDEMFAATDIGERQRRYERLRAYAGARNTESIDDVDGVAAILDGADVESGTASEVGYGFARGKWLVGLRIDFRLTGEGPLALASLQVEHFIDASGGVVVKTVPDLVDAVRQRVASNTATLHARSTLHVGDERSGNKNGEGILRNAGIGFLAQILLGLVLAAALDGLLKHMQPRLPFAMVAHLLHGSGKPAIRLAQLIVFIFTAVRFFWGTYRYHQNIPSDRMGRFWIGVPCSIGVFVGFYFSAVFVWNIPLFYFGLLIVHFVDAIWFELLRGYERNDRIMSEMATKYVCYDAISLVALLVTLPLTSLAPGNPIGPALSLGVIFIIGLYDVIGSREFYIGAKGFGKAT